MRQPVRQRRLLGLLIGVLLSGVRAAGAQQRPLLTEDVEIVPAGRIRLDLGFDFLQNQRFSLSGLRGDLSALGVIALNWGLSSNVEVELQGTIQNFLGIEESFRPSAIPLRLPSPGSTNDVGDFSFWTKILLRRETARVPALGIRAGVELPTTDQSRGIGTNQTNVIAALLVGKQMGRGKIWGNLGVGILSAPLERFQQNDVLVYGLAGLYPVTNRVDLVGEVNGRANTRQRAPLGTESQGQARLGLRLRAGGLRWDVAGVKGLTSFSPTAGIVFGVSFDIPGFRP
ncbi:MAG TPA: hypothetical protein VNM72_04365 [Blastocatellia bacterium]|nr:hypothetical protein [Blastocatellia bacterium]